MAAGIFRVALLPLLVKIFPRNNSYAKGMTNYCINTANSFLRKIFADSPSILGRCYYQMSNFFLKATRFEEGSEQTANLKTAAY